MYVTPAELHVADRTLRKGEFPYGAAVVTTQRSSRGHRLEHMSHGALRRRTASDPVSVPAESRTSSVSVTRPSHVGETFSRASIPSSTRPVENRVAARLKEAPDA